MKEYFKLGILSLMRKKTRTVLTVTSVAVGICAVTVIGSIGSLGRMRIQKEIDGIGMGSFTVSVEEKINPGAAITLPQIERIKSEPGVKKVLPVAVEYTQTTMCGLVGTTAVWGIDSGSDQLADLMPAYGRLLEPADISGARRVCLIDKSMAVSYHKRENIVGKTVGVSFGYGEIEFTIVGVVETGGNFMQTALESFGPSFLYIPYTTLQQLTGKTAFNRIAVDIEEGESAEELGEVTAATLSRLSGASFSNYRIQNISGEKQKLDSILNIVTIILSAIAGISIFVAALGITTVMTVTVNERTREIGIKKAVGAKKGNIMAEFLCEAFLIALCGIFAGYLAGILAVWIVCALLGTGVVLNLSLMAVSGGITALMGIVSGVYPAYAASGLSPVEALRFE